jgi:hypothetical protein
MVARVIAGACVVALAAVSGSRGADAVVAPERPVVVRMSVPLPVEGEQGHASFSASLGRTYVRFAATWSGGEAHRRLQVVLASGPED